MTRRWWAGVAGALLVLSLTSVATPGPMRAALPERLVAFMNPEEVVELLPDLRVGAGTGTAVLWRGSDAGTFCFQLQLNLGQAPGDGQFFGAKLHEGPPGVDGPEVAFFQPLGSHGEIASGCLGGLDPMVVSHLFSEPGDFYVQGVHGGGVDCGLCGYGATRGQLRLGGTECMLSGTAVVGGETVSDASIETDEKFTISGAGFIPWLPVAVAFTPSDGGEPIMIGIEPDALGGLGTTLVGSSVGEGRWTLSIPDAECEGTASLAVRVSSSGAAPSPGVGNGLPDTATTASRAAEPLVLAGLFLVGSALAGAAWYWIRATNSRRRDGTC